MAYNLGFLRRLVLPVDESDWSMDQSSDQDDPDRATVWCAMPARLRVSGPVLVSREMRGTVNELAGSAGFLS